MKPIAPQEFLDHYGSKIPDKVIETVNELLLQSCKQEGMTRIVLNQTQVVEALLEKGFDRSEIFSKKYLDFEPTFRQAGWSVEWLPAAYYESKSSSIWIFTIPKP